MTKIARSKTLFDSGPAVAIAPAAGISGDWAALQIAGADLADAPPELSREKISERLLRANCFRPEVCS
jgi:hypothetical protein